MEDYLKELYYVDYCSQCKDLEIMSPNSVPCHHPWYCHMDNGEVQELESRIGLLNHNRRLRGYSFAYERVELKKLKDKKFNLVKEKLRDFRRQK